MTHETSVSCLPGAVVTRSPLTVNKAWLI